MILSRLKAFAFAVALHAAILLFGGLLLFHKPAENQTTREVELIEDDSAHDEAKKEEAKEAPPEDAAEQSEEVLNAPQEAAPDIHEIAKLEGPASAPALAALSLSELEGALNPDLGGGGSFQEGVSFSSGGRIGGTGEPGAEAVEGDATFALAELDQRPRALSQAMPRYPSELRKRKVQGTVEVVFLVDTDGHVVNPRVDKTTYEGLNQAALEAVRQWRFEAGTKEGKKVRFKMRVPITFSAG